jgi:O-6-methylguanine DNA methyltransferase
MSWLQDPRVDKISGFEKAVYILCSAVPRGRCATYGTLAELLQPMSSQAVGNALSKNCFAPVVPCHRVLKKAGSGSSATLGGFSGVAEGTVGQGEKGEKHHPNIEKKLGLLKEEGVLFDSKLNLLNPVKVLMRASEFDPAAVAQARAVAGRSDTAVAPTAAPSAASAASGASSSSAATGSASATSCAGKKRKRDESEDFEVLRKRLSREGCSGAEVRAACRTGQLTGHTSGLAPGYAQANLCIVPEEYAFDFLLFCTRNPQACPVLEVTAPGNPILPAGTGGAGTGTAPGADLRTDFPRYRIWRHGVPDKEEPTEITDIWKAAEAGRFDATGSSSSSSSASASSVRRPTRLVGFLLGCSFSFEEALLKAGLPVRHLQQPALRPGEDGAADTHAGIGCGSASSSSSSSSASSGGRGGSAAATASAAEVRLQQFKRAKPDPAPIKAASAPSSTPATAGSLGIVAHGLVSNPRNVPMYRTAIHNTRAGPFAGCLVVSMRPMTPAQAQQAKAITAKYPRVHGAPVHIGDPSVLGIKDLDRPDFGDPVTILAGECPVWWACGVTPQAALVAAKIPFAITHAPGHMLVLDKLNSELAGSASIDLGARHEA